MTFERRTCPVPARINIERLCYDDPSVDRGAVQDEARSLALRFFNRHLALGESSQGS